MVTDKTNQQIKLKDGRMLGYAEYGAPEGKQSDEKHEYAQTGYPSQNPDERGEHEDCGPQSFNIA